MFPQDFQDLTDGMNMGLSRVLGIDKDVMEVYNDKNIQLLSQNLVDIPLKTYQSVSQAKRYHLVFEMTVLYAESCLLLIALFDPYTMVYAC